MPFEKAVCAGVDVTEPVILLMVTFPRLDMKRSMLRGIFMLEDGEKVGILVCVGVGRPFLGPDILSCNFSGCAAAERLAKLSFEVDNRRETFSKKALCSLIVALWSAGSIVVPEEEVLSCVATLSSSSKALSLSILSSEMDCTRPSRFKSISLRFCSSISCCSRVVARTRWVLL
jgi:hypothetical protein